MTAAYLRLQKSTKEDLRVASKSSDAGEWGTGMRRARDHEWQGGDDG